LKLRLIAVKKEQNCYYTPPPPPKNAIFLRKQNKQSLFKTIKREEFVSYAVIENKIKVFKKTTC